MSTPTPPPDPDPKRVFLLFRKLGLDDEEAYTLVQEVENMAAANLIARFESKLDIQNARIEAMSAQQAGQLAALDTKLRMLLWIVPVAVTVLGILVRLWV